MSAVRYQSSYNGIIFNRVYGGDPDQPGAQVDAFSESDYRLEAFDDTPMSITDLAEPRQFMEGSQPNQSFESMRVIRGAGRIIAADPTDLEDKMWALRNAFSPATVRRLSDYESVAHYPNEPVGVLPFDFIRDHAPSPLALRYYCRPMQGRPISFAEMEEGLVRRFSFQLAAYDPRCYSQGMKSQNLLADGTVVNDGTAVLYPQYLFQFGAGSHSASLTLTNVSTEQAFVLDVSAFSTAGDWWMLPEEGLLTNTVGDSRYIYRKTGFMTNMFLLPGANSFSVTGTTNLAGLVAYWRDAWS